MPKGTKPKKVAGPKPRTKPKRALKQCDRGHPQASYWKGPHCTACARDAARREDRERQMRDAAAERQVLGPPPEAMEIRTGDGQVLRFDVPLHARQRRRRGPIARTAARR